MKFFKISAEEYSRQEYFEHYYSNVPCTYSLSVNLDVTTVCSLPIKFYPAMIYAITAIVNRHKEFRTSFDTEGNLGYWEQMDPSFTVFHPCNEKFSSLWIPCNETYRDFEQSYKNTITQFEESKELFPQGMAPNHTFPISMIPWVEFTGFHLHLQKGYDYLLPIFTMGKIGKQDSKMILPLSIQVHHAVCDGFHVGRFLGELQDLLNDFPC